MKFVSTIALLVCCSGGLCAKIDQAPQIIKRTAIALPTSIREPARIDVILEVDAEGRVSAAMIDASTNHDLDGACLEALSSWRFRPAFDHGKPVPAQVLQPVLVGEPFDGALRRQFVSAD